MAKVLHVLMRRRVWRSLIDSNTSDFAQAMLSAEHHAVGSHQSNMP